MTELDKPIVRRHGAIVIRITRDGISLRGHKCKRESATVPWDAIAKLALEQERVSLTAEQWRNPMQMIRKLAHLVRRFGTRG